MSTIVLRNTKGSELTYVELDANFTNLNTDKLEKSTDDTTTNSSFYPVFVSAASSNAPKITTTKLSFNPSTGTLTSTRFTGNITATNITEKQTSIAASTIDLSLGTYFTRTVSGSLSLTITNIPTSSNVASFVLELINGGTSVIWWTGVLWPSGVPPTLSGSGKDVLAFYTYDGGITWIGTLIGRDFK